MGAAGDDPAAPDQSDIFDDALFAPTKSGLVLAYRRITMFLISVMSSIEKRTPSRPNPEFFTPP